jgi:hypothetical protein
MLLFCGNSRADGPPPIEVTCNLIQLGMSDEDLASLMAPYQQVCTGHHQWQTYTDGRTKIHITLSMGDRSVVIDKPWFKLVRVGKQTRWVETSRPLAIDLLKTNPQGLGAKPNLKVLVTAPEGAANGDR